MIIKIVSGGQTGVDRGALDAAIELGIPHGGWCPKGRRAEDGRIPDRYNLVECPSPGYPARTFANIKDSDATLVILFQRGKMGPGTELTIRRAKVAGKLAAVVALRETFALSDVIARLDGVETLNVAGPRESGSPGIQEATREFMVRLLTEMRDDQG